MTRAHARNPARSTAFALWRLAAARPQPRAKTPRFALWRFAVANPRENTAFRIVAGSRSAKTTLRIVAGSRSAKTTLRIVAVRGRAQARASFSSGTPERPSPRLRYIRSACADNKMNDSQMEEDDNSPRRPESPKNCGYDEMYGQQDDSPPQDDSPQQHEAQDVEDYWDSGEMQVDPDGEVFTEKSGMTFGKACIVDFTGTHIYFNDGGSDIQTSGETTDDEAPPLHAGSAVLTRTEMQERMSTLRDRANGGTAYTNTDPVWWGDAGSGGDSDTTAEGGQEVLGDTPCAVVAAAPAAAAPWPRAWLEFRGLTGENAQKLVDMGKKPPIQIITLPQANAEEDCVTVGRATHEIECDLQTMMISRWHLKFRFDPLTGLWEIEEVERPMSPANGTLLKRANQTHSERVTSAFVGHGDVITFGGARNTGVGDTPGANAIESIYAYTFHQGV